MTPKQIELVEHHLTELRPMMDSVAADMYARLFAADPAVAELFTTDPDEQRRKLVAELDATIFLIRRHADFLDRPQALGARHVHYGVRAVRYPEVGQASSQHSPPPPVRRGRRSWRMRGVRRTTSPRRSCWPAPLGWCDHPPTDP